MRPHQPGRAAKQELSRKGALAFWCTRPSDTWGFKSLPRLFIGVWGRGGVPYVKVLLSWDSEGVEVLVVPSSRSTSCVHITGWSRGLEVSGGGQGVVSHAGLVLLRHLADKTGLTGGLSRALATPRVLVHDRGQLTADLACAIADGARVISDFRVMSDQREPFGLVASVPTAWRTLKEIACGGTRADRRITAAVNTARQCVGAGGGPAWGAARGAAGGQDPGRCDLHPAVAAVDFTETRPRANRDEGTACAAYLRESRVGRVGTLSGVRRPGNVHNYHMRQPNDLTRKQMVSFLTGVAVAGGAAAWLVLGPLWAIVGLVAGPLVVLIAWVVLVSFVVPDPVVHLRNNEPYRALTEIGRDMHSVRRLARAWPSQFREPLAQRLLAQAEALRALNRTPQALAPAHEAVLIFRELVSENPGKFKHGLAHALHSEAVLLGAADRLPEAIETIAAAIGHYRDLGNHLPDLADALTHQAQWLRDLGHDAEAEVSASEASSIGHQIENRR